MSKRVHITSTTNPILSGSAAKFASSPQILPLRNLLCNRRSTRNRFMWGLVLC